MALIGKMETAAMAVSTRGKSFREHQRQEIEQLRERLLYIASGGEYPMTQPGHGISDASQSLMLKNHGCPR